MKEEEEKEIFITETATGENNNNDNNPRAERKRGMVLELVKGRESAKQLQTLLQNPAQDHHDGGPASPSVKQLALQILRSFSVTLSVLSSCTPPPDSAHIAAVDGGGSACSGESMKRARVRDRRGCYKRRRTTDLKIEVSSTMEDGRAWRKYGQKDILNSKYPRFYFRCTHKHEGCKASKQVQKIKEDPILYQTTYFNHHTCTDTLRAPQLIADADPFESNLIGFGGNIHSTHDQYSPDTVFKNDRAVEKESKEDTGSTEEVFGHANPSADPWGEIIELQILGYKPDLDPIISSYQKEEGSGTFQSCGSTSLPDQLDDMEVNLLGDIDNFHCFDDGRMYC